MVDDTKQTRTCMIEIKSSDKAFLCALIAWLAEYAVLPNSTVVRVEGEI